MSEASIPDWISSISAAAGAVAVVFGLLGANRKIEDFQTNTRLLKRSETAENLIALALKVEDAFRDIRDPFDSIPLEKAADKGYRWQRRYDRVAKYNDLFQRFRDAQIRQRTLIGDSEVDHAIDDLFKSRNTVVAAIRVLSENSGEAESDAELRKLKMEARRELYGSFSERDAFGMSILASVQKVEGNLKSFARLEGGLSK